MSDKLPLIELPNGDQAIPRIKMDIARAPISFGYDLRIYGQHIESRRFWKAKPIEFVEILDRNVSVDPTITLEPDGLHGPECLQTLMDQMWSMGMRPTELRHHAPIDPQERVALKAHIADLQYIMRSKARKFP